MRSRLQYAILILLSGAIAVSCSTPAETVEFSEHPDGWVTEGSSNFHGLFVLESTGKTTSCASCHGADLKGDQTKGVPSCFQCHASYPHPDGFATDGSTEFHAVAVAETYFWDLSTCKSCHGSDYRGNNVSAKNCRTCHTDQDDGPEACTTCHGGGDNVAPPEDLLGNVATTFPGVGAHETHLEVSTLTDAFVRACDNCHTSVVDFDDENHIDGGPAMAELNFGDLATHGGLLATNYDFATQTCSNVYCHGNFTFLKSESSNPFVYVGETIEGNKLDMTWTAAGTGAAACGTCHGLPPTGHAVIPACENCHGRVVDANKNIIDPSLHINGEIDVF